LLIERVLGGGGAEGRDVSGDERAVVLRGFFGIALEREGEFDVTAHQFFLQQAADAHLEGFQAGGHAELRVEEAVVHALEADGEAQAVGDPACEAREASHGVDGVQSGQA
jgi:hypothetical protein